MTTSSSSVLPASLVSNLQQVLVKRNGGEDEQSKKTDEEEELSFSSSSLPSDDCSKPIVLVTNGEGIDAPGLTILVEALVRQGLFNVNVCAPQSDRSDSSHSMTPCETLTVSPIEINGAAAYQVSGTPADCVSLSLSGALFSWSKPALVISGINRGTNCGHRIFYSGAVAGAREALISGVPSISISLNWNKDKSHESDYKDAVEICLPLIRAAIRDIEKEIFPKSCSLNVHIPTSPSTNKGFKVTKQSLQRWVPRWEAVSANRHPSGGHFMSNQQSLGIQLAQLSRDASAAGAARRLNTQRKIIEVESVGVAGKSDQRVKKYFRLELVEEEEEEKDRDEELDFRALESGFVVITPLSLTCNTTGACVSEWVAALS